MIVLRVMLRRNCRLAVDVSPPYSVVSSDVKRYTDLNRN